MRGLTIGVEIVSTQALQSEKLRRFHQIWTDLKGAGDLPLRAEVSPERLGFMLGHVSIIEVLREPLNFRYKLIGTKIEDAGRHGDQGKTVDQIEPACYRDMVSAACRTVVDTAQPLVHQVTYLHHQNRVKFERVILPFTVSGGVVEVLLEGSDWLTGSHQDLRNLVFSRPDASSGTTYRSQSQ